MSSDVVAELNNKSHVQCVAKLITSKPFLTKLQNDTYYFSPYGNTEQITNKKYLDVYKNYLKLLPNLKWVKSVSKEELLKVNYNWQLIKLKLRH